MKIMYSFFSAFLMYSRIPMPHTPWKEENRRYALCFFPLIGVVIGTLMILWQWVCIKLNLERAFFAAIAVLIPVIITGGIHLDGYMDVCDANACLGDKEKRFEVMKDSRVGAFAIIHVICMFIFNFICLYEMATFKAMLVAGFCYVVSRAFSAIAAVTFKNARGEGSLNNFTAVSAKYITITAEIVMICVCAIIMMLVNVVYAVCALACMAFVFVMYRVWAYKQYGGITGDIAGYFLVVCEAVGLFSVVIGEIVCSRLL